MPRGKYLHIKITGKKWSEERKEKHSKLFKKLYKEGKLYMPPQNDDNNPMWKGDNVGYFALHSWIRRKLGIPQKCEICKTTEIKRYEWANKNGKYNRDFNNWIRVCKFCHENYFRFNNNTDFLEKR